MARLASVVSVGAIWVSGKKEPTLGGGFTVVPAVYVVGILGCSVYLVTVRYRTPRGVD